VALYLTDHLAEFLRPEDARALADPPREGDLHERERRILDLLRARGASFFPDLHDLAGSGFPADTVDALWSLVWKGYVSNDTLRALRAYLRGAPGTPGPAARRFEGRIGRLAPGRGFRSRRLAPPAGEGRWSLVESRMTRRPTPTEWSAATAEQLLARHGIVTREVALAEGIAGGFSAVYDVLRTLEDAGRIRRGYFVSGVGALQFATPAALDLLRSLRTAPEPPEVVHLAATDPANPYGALLRWPSAGGEEGGHSLARVVGAQVILVNGSLAAYLGRGGRQLYLLLPEEEPERAPTARAVAARLAEMARARGRKGLLVAEIDGAPAREHPMTDCLREAGFTASTQGLHLTRERAAPAADPRARA
jgi:ATP-dependent Lhr-like helicase